MPEIKGGLRGGRRLWRLWGDCGDGRISRSAVAASRKMRPHSPPRGTISRMNIRRGMNRLFIVAWVVYGVWLLWYVIREPINRDEGIAFQELQSCYHISPGATWNQCSDAYRQSVNEAEQAGYREMRQPSWIGLVLLALVVPPLLVYGVVLLLVKIAKWVVAGFRTTTSQGPQARPG